MAEQEVFSDQENERNDESQPPYTSPNLSKYKLCRPIEDEIKKLTIAIVEKEKRNYRLRNTTTNTNDGTPRGLFLKDKETTQEKPKKVEIKEPNKNEKNHVSKEGDKELYKNK